MEFDVLVVGAGIGGIPCAITAGEAGVRVLLVDKDDRVGGDLHVWGGHLSAAGTRRQRKRGIADDVASHLDDIVRISGGTARNPLVTVAVEHAGETVDWLDDAGFAFDERTPRIVHGHEPYLAPRSYHGVDEGRSILAVLEPLLRPHLWLGARRRPAPGVRGGRRCGGGARTACPTRSAPPRWCSPPAASEPRPTCSLSWRAPRWSARRTRPARVTAWRWRSRSAVRSREGMYLPTFGGRPHPEDPGRVQWSDRPLLAPAKRAPWEIHIDLGGQRFVAEDEPSIDRKERLLAGLKDLVFFQVFFQVFYDAAVTFSPNIVLGWSRRTSAPGCANGRACSLRTASPRWRRRRHRRPGAAGDGGPLQRRRPPQPSRRAGASRPADDHRPSAVLRPAQPRHHAHRLRRRRCARRPARPPHDGSVVPGLYVVGEVIGAVATMGNSFCGGMCVTPALTLGRLLGRRLAPMTAGA